MNNKPWYKRVFLGNLEVLIFIIALCFKSILFNKLIGVFYTHPRLLLSSLGTAVFFAGFSLLFKRKPRLVLLMVFDILFSVIMLGDLVYFRYYNDVISMPVLRQVVLMDSVKNSVTSLFRIDDLCYISDIVLSFPFIVLLFRKGPDTYSGSLKLRALKALSVLLVGASLVSYGFIQINSTMGSKIFSFVLDRTYFVQNIGILNFHGFDAYSTLARSVSKGNITDAAKNQIKAAFNSSGNNGDSKLNGAAKGYNLIVVQGEALQNMLINMKINGKEITPNLNKFINRSVYFKNYFSQAAQGNTSDAEFLSNVSLYPLNEGAVYFLHSGNTFEALPKAMKEQGYKTLAMHAYKGSYWNRSSIYPVLGFDEFVNMSNYNIDERMGWGLSDKSFFHQNIERLQKVSGPFYAFMITLSAHHPYDAFEDKNDFDAAPFNHTFFGNYLKAQHYADEAFGTFFEELEKSGLMNNSIIVIYGDHAGIQKDRLDANVKSFLKLDDNNDLSWVKMMNVPLIIHFPGDKEAGLRTLAGGQVDLYPTLANLFDFKPKYTLGKDLFNTENGYTIFRDGSITDGKETYLSKYGSSFDMVSGQKLLPDPLKENADMAKKQLELSDDIIDNNLIKYFEKEDVKH